MEQTLPVADSLSVPPLGSPPYEQPAVEEACLKQLPARKALVEISFNGVSDEERP